MLGWKQKRIQIIKPSIKYPNCVARRKNLEFLFYWSLDHGRGMMTSYLGSLGYKSWKLTKIMPNSLKLLNHYILSNAPQKIRHWALKSVTIWRWMGIVFCGPFTNSFVPWLAWTWHGMDIVCTCKIWNMCKLNNANWNFVKGRAYN